MTTVREQESAEGIVAGVAPREGPNWLVEVRLPQPCRGRRSRLAESLRSDCCSLSMEPLRPIYWNESSARKTCKQHGSG